MIAVALPALQTENLVWSADHTAKRCQNTRRALRRNLGHRGEWAQPTTSTRLYAPVLLSYWAPPSVVASESLHPGVGPSLPQLRTVILHGLTYKVQGTADD